MAEKNFKITGGLALGDYALTANGLSLLWDSNAIASESYVDTAVAGATVNVEALAGTGLFDDSGELAVNTNVIATKSYVDSVAQGLDVKESVRYATTEELIGTYSGESNTFTMTTGGITSIDGQAANLNDRVLIKNQSTTGQNGIYTVTTAGADDGRGTVTATVFTRADDALALDAGAFTFIEVGSVNAAKGFVYNSDAGTWSQFSEAGSLTAGSNIYLDSDAINVNVNSLVGDLDGVGLYVSGNTLAVNVNALVSDIDANGYLRAISNEVTLPGSGDFTITSSENIVLNSGAGKTAYLEDAAVAGNEIATKSYVDGIVNTNAIAGSLASATLYTSNGDDLNVNVNAIVGDLDGSGLYVDGNALAVNTNAVAESLASASIYVDSGDNLNVNVEAIVGEGLFANTVVNSISIDQYAAGVRFNGTSGAGAQAAVTTDTLYATTETSDTYVTVGSFYANRAFTLDILMINDVKVRKSIVSGITDGSGTVEYTEYAIVDSATAITAPDIFIEWNGDTSQYDIKAKATLTSGTELKVIINSAIIGLN